MALIHILKLFKYAPRPDCQAEVEARFRNSNARAYSLLCRAEHYIDGDGDMFPCIERYEGRDHHNVYVELLAGCVEGRALIGDKAEFPFDHSRPLMELRFMVDGDFVPIMTRRGEPEIYWEGAVRRVIHALPKKTNFLGYESYGRLQKAQARPLPQRTLRINLPDLVEVPCATPQHAQS